MANYTKLLDESTWSEVNQESKDLLEDYILELEATGKSAGTIKQYTADIKGFYSWIYRNGNNKCILELKKRDFRNFFLKMSKNGTSNARINRLQSSVRNLLLYAENEDDLYADYEVNQMRAIKGVPKESVRDIVFLTDEQVTGIIDYLLKRKEYQKALYVSLSYDSAGRRNEIHQVKKEGFLENTQTNETVGKRGKKFKLLYFNRTREIAKLWLEQRGDDDIDSLWVTGKGDNKRELSYESLYSFAVSLRPIIKKLYNEDLELNSHSFRHAALTNYNNGTHAVLKELGKDSLPLSVLKLIAHHASSETTESYIKSRDEEVLSEAFGIKI